MVHTGYAYQAHEHLRKWLRGIAVRTLSPPGPVRTACPVATGGVYSYFNGIASHDEFLHRVYCNAVRRHLSGLGFAVTFQPVPVDGAHAPGVWDGAEAGRNWWDLKQYLVPVCTRT